MRGTTRITFFPKALNAGITTFSELSNGTFNIEIQEYLQKSVEGFQTD